MTPSFVRHSAGALLAAFTITALASAADSSTTNPATGKAGTSTQRTSTARGATRGTLPDPTLLDGSTLPAEKKSEYGMIGDFELPGDENARSDKVGGPQKPGGALPGLPTPGAGLPGLPTPGVGLPGLPSTPSAALPGLPNAGLPQIPQAGSGGGGEQGNLPPQQGAGTGGPVAGAGDPNAKAEGQQVGQLGGESSGDQAAGGGQKPAPVAIGDRAMRIPQASQGAAGVVGGSQQVQGNTQHHEKGTGSGGKPPTGVQGNNRTEKGRAIPAGL